MCLSQIWRKELHLSKKTSSLFTSLACQYNGLILLTPFLYLLVLILYSYDVRLLLGVGISKNAKPEAVALNSGGLSDAHGNQ